MLRNAMSAMVLLGLLSGPAVADTLLIDGIAPADSASFPVRGSTSDEVLTSFGEPVARTAAVGEPPISRWEYGSFVVFFEYDYVLHAVAKR